MEKSNHAPNLFITNLDEPFRSEFQVLDEMISKHFPNHEKILWTGKFWGGSEQNIIGYGTWSYTNSAKKKVEWFLIGLALQKNYISLYVNAVENGKYVSEIYGKDLGKVKIGKSSISFKSIADLDIFKLNEFLKHTSTILQG